jgi:hypothetical protein
MLLLTRWAILVQIVFNNTPQTQTWKFQQELKPFPGVNKRLWNTATSNQNKLVSWLVNIEWMIVVNLILKP